MSNIINVLFVLDKMDIGGLQKVNATIGDYLNKNKKLNIRFLTLRKSNNETIKVESPVDLLIRNNMEKMISLFLRIINKASQKIFSVDSKLLDKYISHLITEYLYNNPTDAIILSGPSLFMAKNIKNNFPNTKVIMWMHNGVDVYFQSYFKTNKLNLKQNLGVADKIVTLSNKDCNDYKKYNDKVVKIYNPLTIKNDTNEMANLHKHIISFVGRIDIYHKGIDYLVKIASMLPGDWKISIAGSGSDSAMKRFNKLINEYNCSEKIIFKGNLIGEELNKHYLNSSIFLMTSRYEGFGLVIPEAMSFGLPIIAFAQSGANEILHSGEYGVVIKNGDVNLLFSSLMNFIEDFKLRQEYGEKSRFRVTEFQLQKISKRWTKLIENEVWSES